MKELEENGELWQAGKGAARQQIDKLFEEVREFVEANGRLPSETKNDEGEERLAFMLRAKRK